MMRKIWIIIGLIISVAGWSQDVKTKKEICQLIRLNLINDTINGIYCDTSIIHDENRIILIVEKQNSNGYNQQIFVLQRINNILKIIDSTKIYDRDGKGPHVMIDVDTLHISHSYHGGYYTLYYKFSMIEKKYKLVVIEQYNVLHENKRYNNDPTGFEKQTYNVINEELTIIKNIKDKRNKEKLISKKNIIRKIPKTFIPDLAHFIDPLGEDNQSDVYKKIFQYKVYQY